MFLGHYAFGFYLKQRNRDVPLWILFLGVQFADLLWALLILLGVEKAGFHPDASVFLRGIYEYYPYSHSLFSGLCFALLAYGILSTWGKKRWALVTAIAIVSHWFLDVLVHVPDVPLFFNSYKLGLGIWSFPVQTLILEEALFAIGFVVFRRGAEEQRSKWWGIGLYLFLAAFYAASFFAPAIPPTAVQVGIFGILIYGGIPLVTFFAERKKIHRLTSA